MTRGVTKQNLSEEETMLALITTAHRSCYPNPIAFRAGERVRIGHGMTNFRAGCAPLPQMATRVGPCRC